MSWGNRFLYFFHVNAILTALLIVSFLFPFKTHQVVSNFISFENICLKCQNLFLNLFCLTVDSVYPSDKQILLLEQR